MITSLRIANFKAAASVTVPLGPITVLIGPNDSGKSTILQALMALSRAADKARLGPEQILDCPLAVAATNQDLSTDIVISAEGETSSHLIQQNSYQYSISISAHEKAIASESIIWGSEQLSEEALAPFERNIESIPPKRHSGGSSLSLLATATNLNKPYRLSIETITGELGATLLRLDARAIARPSPLGAPLLDDGFGIVGIVDELLTSGVDDEKVARVTEVIQRLTPHVKSLATRRHPPSGGKELHFVLRSGAVIPASQMSDGVLLATALIVISLAAGTKRLLVEEPENGLHPRQLRIVAETIRSIATEHDTQVVLTTHSPLLLNYFGAEEVLLVTRTEAGVSVRPMDKTKGFDELATEMSLGELWYNVGDSDLARPA